MLQVFARSVIRAGQCQGGGHAPGDIMGKARPREHRGEGRGHHFRNDLRRTKPGAMFDPFAAGDQMPVGQMRAVFCQKPAQLLRWHGEKADAAFRNVRHLRSDPQILGQHCAGQPCGVFAVAVHFLCAVLVARPKRDRPVARQRNGQRRAKRARSKYIHALAPFFPPPSSAGLDLSRGQRGRAARVMSSRRPSAKSSAPA